MRRKCLRRQSTCARSRCAVDKAYIEEKGLVTIGFGGDDRGRSALEQPCSQCTASLVGNDVPRRRNGAQQSGKHVGCIAAAERKIIGTAAIEFCSSTTAGD